EAQGGGPPVPPRCAVVPLEVDGQPPAAAGQVPAGDRPPLFGVEPVADGGVEDRLPPVGRHGREPVRLAPLPPRAAAEAASERVRHGGTAPGSRRLAAAGG